MRAEVALSTSKSDFPNFSTTLDFINPNGPQPVIGRSIDNGVPLAFDLRHGTIPFGIDQASPFPPTTAPLTAPATYPRHQVALVTNPNTTKERPARPDLP